MIQDILALTIVFSAAGYTVYSIIKSLTAPKTSNCGGCEGCSFKDMPMVNKAKVIQNKHFQFNKLMPVKQVK